jgi:hypothetical protein
MCSKCENVLLGFSIPHAVANCPLVHASYCSVCCSYGHLTEDCPDQEILSYRKPTYVEQLVPSSLLSRYKITTQTPLEYQEDSRPKGDVLLEIEETDKAIRQVLMNYSIQPSGRMKENRRLLKQLSDEMGRKLVYLKPQ